MNRKILAVLLVLVTAGSVLTIAGIGAAPASASENVAYDGSAADSADKTNTTILTEGNPTGMTNFTVNMTEGWDVPDNGQIVFDTNDTTPASAEVSAGNSSAVGVTVNDGNITISDSTSDGWAEHINGVNITFNVSTDPATNGSLPDAVDVSNASANETTLIQDPDHTENHTYIVLDRFADVTYSVDGEAGGEIADGEYEPNASGQVTITADVTRNGTDYTEYNASTLKFEMALNTTYYSDIEEVTDEASDGLTLEDEKTEDGMKVFVWSVQNPDNTTSDYWDDLEVAVNATAESGEANDTLRFSETHDPEGGVEATYDETFDHAAGGIGVSGPQFTNIFTDNPIIAGVIGLAVVGGIVYFLMRDKDEKMTMNGYAAYTGGWMLWAWLIVGLVGLSMVADVLLDSFVQFDFWTNLLADNSLMLVGDMTPLLGGVILLVVALALNAQNSNPTG